MRNTILLFSTLAAGVCFGQAPGTGRLISASVDRDGWKTVFLNTKDAKYELGCDVGQKTCITPEPNHDYYLIDRDTNFTLPGASSPMTLSFLEDFYISYNNGENIALWPVVPRGGTVPGIYRLQKMSVLPGH